MTGYGNGVSNEPIAVIGTGCRFPGNATTPSKLWELIKKPRDLMSKVPLDRFNVDAFYHPDGSHHGRTNVPYCYPLDGDVGAFDAAFFNIPPHEVEAIDPGHRLILETVYEALSTAGLRIEDLQGSPTAVYVGQMMNDYKDVVNFDLDALPTYAATGTAASIISNRVSYFFDWHGPSVAVHHAIQQLRSGSSKVAIAAGANLILSPVPFIVESKLNMLSPTGRSRMWDAGADGYARGEGVAAVVLKTLSQALLDGDSIECIIRESGVNQDGRTPGITMPNHAAQIALIHDTYRKAGLDPRKAHDRCQYFEAHGTGTKAGDAKEAEAIATAFFDNKPRPEGEDVLHVGSIKTVIGHTEGTAGVAGLMRVSLAMKNRTLPPNLLFEKLSPGVAPFYHNLSVVTEARPWPELQPGMPMRASVNSFGFGGTNAHIIVESYDKQVSINNQDAAPIMCSPSIPLQVSAHSEKALKATMENLVQFLKTDSSIQVQDVAWTLMEKRSVLPVRRAITGSLTVSSLCSALEEAIAGMGSNSSGSKDEEPLVVTNGLNRKPEILGIFTGQGAQWPAMGKILITSLPYAREIIDKLDDSLRTLPEEYRPQWTLMEQLCLEGSESTVNDASYSQPLCCAVQVILVDLLTKADIKFKALVGHSSGEIACAYAAGLLTASQAIRTAYLRGLICSQSSKTGGGMLAAGTTYDDAQDLCSLDVMRDRLCVAACNASDSVTLSGDLDAVKRAELVFGDEGKFARLLKVDKAYHSSHMFPCADPYMKALEASGCASSSPWNDDSDARPVWMSSVHKGRRMTHADVTAEYWKDNLVNPVLFSQALEHVVAVCSPIDMAVEVGCHPALKSPALSTLGKALPYTGLMRRGANDLDAFVTALGYIWERFGSRGVDIASFDRVLPDRLACRNLVKILPPYPWDHSRSYWIESRRTRESFLAGGGRGGRGVRGGVGDEDATALTTTSKKKSSNNHILLGRLSPLSTPWSWKWQNTIRRRDISWLDGHQLQGQTVFPGAGYVVMVAEAALHIAAARGRDRDKVQLIELSELTMFKATTFGDENSHVELNLSIDLDINTTTANTNSPDALADDVVTATFKIDCCHPKETAMSLSNSGKLVISCGPVSPQALPATQTRPPHATSINTESFYKELATVGYHYTKEFKGLTSIRRADNKACGTIRVPPSASASGITDSDDGDALLLHPAILDVAFQTLIGAVSAPGDGLMQSLLVPTSIGRIALNPSLCSNVTHVPASATGEALELQYNAMGTASQMSSIRGDIEVFVVDDNDDKEKNVLLQIDNITTKTASAASTANDHVMFATWEWNKLVPDRVLNKPEYAPTDHDRELAAAMERLVYFYIRTFLNSMVAEQKDVASLAPHHQRQIAWFQYKVDEAHEGRSLFYKSAWENDTEADIENLVNEYRYNAHVRLIQRVGEGLADVFHNGRNAFELMDHDGLLSEFYGSDTGFGPAYYYMQDAIVPLTHRYQNMDVLEIGAGTGGATKYVLRISGKDKDATPAPSFNSYTYTDISPSFFEKALETFAAPFEDRFEFRALDVRRNPEDQGFRKHSYDLIIASNVLHATPKLQETMTHVRTLLKPGGQLVVVELTNNRHSRIGFIFGLFADWWAGVDEGRVTEPYVSIQKWDEILSNVGFSGVSSVFEDAEGEIFPTSVFRAEAVNDKMLKLSQPLLSSKDSSSSSSSPPTVIIGGSSSKTLDLSEAVQKDLPNRQFTVVKRLEDLVTTKLVGDEEEGMAKRSFIILSDLDDELFPEMGTVKFEALQKLFRVAKHLIWVTENAWVAHPHQAMSIGLLRTLRLEYPTIHMQVVDVHDIGKLAPGFLAECMLRLEDGADLQDAGVLWSEEPEIYLMPPPTAADGVDTGSSALVPMIARLKPDRVRNDCLNSRRREILVDVNPAESPVALGHSKGVTYLESEERHSPVPSKAEAEAEASVGFTNIRVHHSLARAIRVGHFGYFYLVQGIDTKGQPVVALSEKNASLVEVSTDRVLPIIASTCSFFAAYDSSEKSRLLLSMAADLLAQTLVSDTPRGARILIYMAPQNYAKSIARRAKAKGVHVTFASSSSSSSAIQNNASDISGDGGASSWIQLHDKETEAGLIKALPKNVTAFYNFSSVDRGVGRAISKLLAQRCPTYQVEHLGHLEASTWIEEDGGELRTMLEQAVATAVAAAAVNLDAMKEEVVAATPVQELVTLQRSIDFSTLVDWRAHDAVKARAMPIDSGRLFSDDKSYLLVGLTGDLGRSICRWMLGHGAKHVVLSSRRPQIDQEWIDEMSALGGNIMVLPMDVSDEKSLDDGLEKIGKSMPAIAGVAFGPLVLQDVLFKNMSLDMMDAVLAPKVKGARLLNDRLLGNKPDDGLEFFIMLSSFVMVCGNPGQAAYSAANAYTHSLAKQRRARGLAGSTMDMGAIWGVGYIVRQGRDDEYETISFKFDKVSEQELHALFAESVVVGRPGVRARDHGRMPAPEVDEIEIMTGMRFLDPNNKDRIPHFTDPRLGHFILSEQRANLGGAEGQDLESVKDKLQKAATRDEIYQIIADGLVEKLRSTLQITQDAGISLEVPLIDQGVDSLSAVTVGTWFTKNLNLDLPLLKILGGASIKDLSEEAADRLVPLLLRNDASGPTANKDSGPATNGANGELATMQTNGGVNGSSEHKVSMSLNQEYSWKLQKHASDPTIFNSTIGMYMKGFMDLDRLAQAFKSLLHRHEVLRTRFPGLETDVADERPMQVITEESGIRFEVFEVADYAEAEQGFARVDGATYDIAAGETLKIVDFHWLGAAQEHENILIIAYNGLSFDGWSYERFFVELSQTYDGVQLPPAPHYADFAVRQRLSFEQGGMELDLTYWKSVYQSFPPTLPVMSLSPKHREAGTNGTSPQPADEWAQHVTKARVPAVCATRIREASRKWKATPMQFYLAAYAELLSQLTSTTDVCIGVADANRQDADDLVTIGPFLNMLPVRLQPGGAPPFSEALTRTKEQMRRAQLHSRTPHSVVLESLGLDPLQPETLIQAVFDYKQGQAESGTIGEAYMAGVLASRSRTPYDVTLEMSDDPTKEPLVTFKLKSSVYDVDDVNNLLERYMAILDVLSS